MRGLHPQREPLTRQPSAATLRASFARLGSHKGRGEEARAATTTLVITVLDPVIHLLKTSVKLDGCPDQVRA